MKYANRAHLTSRGEQCGEKYFITKLLAVSLIQGVSEWSYRTSEYCSADQYHTAYLLLSYLLILIRHSNFFVCKLQIFSSLRFYEF